MKTHSGRHPRVTAEQIAAILEWHSNRRTFDDWARIFGVARATVQTSIAAYVSPEQWHFAHKRVDGTGKRRYLSSEQMQEIMSWYRSHRTRRELARALGLSIVQVARVVKDREMHIQRRRDEEARAWLASEPERRRERWRQLRAENTARFQAWLVADQR